METLALFILTYLILFILYIIFYYIKGLKKNKILNSMQLKFLKIRFGFKNKDFNIKKIGLLICFIDPLIISITVTIVSLPKWNYVLELLLGFVILLLLIYSFYEIIGRIKKRMMKK